MKPFLIIKTGGTFADTVPETGDFEDWTRRGMGLDHGETLTVPVFEGVTLPPPGTVCAAVITGSHAMVTDTDTWIEETAAWLRQAIDRELPILGICFGHQLLTRALGGRSGWNPEGREIGTVEVTLTGEGQKDPLFQGLPCTFPAQVTHRQSALTLPPGASLLASSAEDPHQAFACGSAWGVQFHPEFSSDAMHLYIETLSTDLSDEGLVPERLHQAVRPTPTAASILKRFVQLIGQQKHAANDS
jgi:GMP synthase (glutamine-hydrolysing)